MNKLHWKYHDGGRSKWFTGDAGDCVTRAISIASDQDYKTVYDKIFQLQKDYRDSHRNFFAKHLAKGNNASPRDGVWKQVIHDYVLSLGFTWIPTMKIGTGCKVHMKADELPKGTLILRVSRHMVTVIDHTIFDNHDPSRNGTRCVYGYYQKII